MQVGNARFVIETNKHDGKTYIATFRYVRKSFYVDDYPMPFKTAIEVAVFNKPSNSFTAWLQSIWGSVVNMQFSDFDGMTKEQQDDFVSMLVRYENFVNLDDDDALFDFLSSRRYERLITKSLNIPSFRFIKTILYMHLNREQWENIKPIVDATRELKKLNRG